jgi:hypothetical protein
MSKKRATVPAKKTVTNDSEASVEKCSDNFQPPKSDMSSFTANAKDVATLNPSKPLSQRMGVHSSVASDSILQAGRIDPFSILPANDTAPNVRVLMHHCENTLHWPYLLAMSDLS